MKLISRGGTHIRISPFLLLFIAGICLLGEWISVLVYGVSLILHEQAHFIFAKALGYRVTSLELHPFGFSAQLDRQIFAWDELCIAFAGPLCSILTGVVCVAIKTLPSFPPIIGSFSEANFAIGFINLLPAVPLDGGRILRGFLQTGRINTQRCVSFISILFACALIALGFFLALKTKNLTALVMGIFLLSAALRELNGNGVRNIQAHLENRSRIIRGEAIPVRQFCAKGDMMIGEACRLSIKNGYTVWYVLDSDLQICGRLDEAQLLYGASELGSHSTLFALVDRLRESC